MLLLTLAAVGLFAAAAVADARTRRIPNPLSAGLALLGLLRLAAPLAVATLGAAAAAGDIPATPDLAAAGIAAAADLGVALAVFILGAVGFRLGVFGGGDAKLLAAGTLWLGAASLAPFLVTTVLAGGVLAAGYLAARLLPGRGPTTLPYGIAIAAGGILTSAAPLLA